VLEVRDEESGIKSITYMIYDATLESEVWTSTEDAQTLPRVHVDERPEIPDGPDGPSQPTGPSEGHGRPVRVCTTELVNFRYLIPTPVACLVTLRPPVRFFLTALAVT